MRSTFREKLEWLEEAENLTLRLRASREKAAGAGQVGSDQSSVISGENPAASGRQACEW
jgi:hypothetical protein